MNRHILVGSAHKESNPHATIAPRVHPQERAEVTIRLVDGTPETLAEVATWSRLNALNPTFYSNDQKLLKVQGSLEHLEEAFGVELHQHEQYRSHVGPVSVDDSVAPLISGVFGLDNRPCAKPRIIRTAKRVVPFDEKGGIWRDAIGMTGFSKPSGSFTPHEVASLYDFPAGDGDGQCIALIELGGGYRTSDLNAYWSYLGIQGPKVVSVGVNGGKNAPGSDADGEVELDIEVAGSIANKATIAVYFADNSEQGFLDACSQAVHDSHLNPSVISISWGGPEDSWTPAAMTQFEAIFQEATAKGISVFVAAGDNGSSDGETGIHVDCPGCCPSATSCGGTRLVANGGTIVSEVVWNDQSSGEGATGGGYSSYWPEPSYQSQEGREGHWRGVPDCSGNADPETPYIVRVDGALQGVGGTSAVSPLLAGLTARLNQITGKRLGAFNPVAYANPQAFRDITSGNNGQWEASKGWDSCSGLGVVVGSKLLEAIQS